MKKIFLSLVFGCIFTLGDFCQPDWYNKCRAGGECCSGNCDKDPSWEFGVCKPGSTPPPTKCENDWFNKCTNNDHCCSGFCEKDPQWQYGICKPKVTEPPKVEKCQEDWSNQCVGNEHCCSGLCDRNPEHKFGICRPKPTEPPKFDKCGEDWSNQCIENVHCCSGICDRNPEHKFGICKPKPTEPPKVEKCGEDWSNQCIDNDHCCSGLCDRNPDHKYGVCKPKPTEPEQKCGEDWVGDCSNDEQCCSSLCKKEKDQNTGFCRPKGGKECEDDWFNECVGNQQCCSGFCDKEPSWKYGVCKQRSNPSTGNKDCSDLHEIGCKNTRCCNNLICSNGPYDNWIQGMCVDETSMTPKENPDDIDEDEEEDFAYYKQFVQDKLFLKNDETFESEPLKCRDIDVKGQYFYKYNETHSFRVCDVCKDFPFQKLKDVRISNPPIKLIPDTSFQECFTTCTEEENCVAVSFDEDANVCHMFDSIDGNYSDDEYGWATIILTQPIFILRDYALSRHTQLICESAPSYQYDTDDVLVCFSRCEKHNCYASTYHDGKCEIYQEEKTCKNIYYKYGHYSLFYRDYFHDNDEWRFSEIVKDGSDEELDDIITREELQGSGGSSTGPRVPQSSNLTIFETQKLQRESFLNSCFKNCLEAEICTGVLINYDKLICQIKDWDGVKSRNYPDKGFREYKLIHKRREKVLYGYDENTYFKLNRITYNEELKTQNLKDCINKCNEYNHCNDIYFNLNDKTCLIVGEFPKRSKNIDPDKWINFKTTNKLTFNHAQFRFSIIGKNQYLSQNFDKYLLDTIRLDERPAESESATEKCFKKCNERSDDCQFVQISRSENFIECKIYKDVPDEEEWKYADKIHSDLYARQMVAKFNTTYLNQLEVFNEYDALNCKPDAESISQEAYYLYKNHDLDKINELTRTKRNIFKKIGNFFKKVGKAIIDVPKKIIETGVKVVKSIDKAVKGDKKGALKEFREAPLVKSAEKLYHDVKTVGEGIVQGDIKKIGKGALGVVTSDFVDFIPGPGKIISTAGKGLKGAINGGKNAVKDKGKKDSKKGKDDIAKKNNQKSDEKKKKDKEEKEKKCAAKSRKKRASAGDKRKRDDCNDKNCPKPQMPQGSRGKLLPKSFNKCNNVKPKGKCNYLCNAGYTEDPYLLTCQNDGKWDKSTGCKPQDCGSGRNRLIFVSSAAAHYATGKGDDALLYAVLLDTDKRSPVWSITYHKWQITNVKPDSRPGHFLQHPCTSIKDKQLTNAHFERKNNPKGYQKGHLSPADLYRWNEKSTNSGNLYINIAPQGGKFNMGSWKTLETSVQCASKNKIKAIVVTGHGGKVIDQIGSIRSRVEVKEYFWKLVCYKFKGKTHVAAFRGSNSATATESQAAKKETLTPRNQQDIINISPELSNPASSPWTAAVKMIASDKFALINRYPLPQDCMSAMTLDDDQKKYWKSQFNIFNSKRKKRETGEKPFCSQKELGDFASWMGQFAQDEEKMNDEANNEDDDDGDDGGEIKNIPAKNCGKKVVGYYASWGKNIVKKSTLSRFTHIIYAFLEVEPNGRVRLGNPDHASSSAHDEVRQTAEKRLNHLLNLRDKINGLKVLFAVGGWENSQYFSRIAASSDMKTTFIASVLKIIDDYSLDGVDIDWEYPVAGGAVTGVSEDKQNYVKLMSDLRFALDEKAKQSGREKYLLTFAGAAGETALRVGYDLPGLLKYADWVNVMSYDFFGPWESKWGAYTGPPSPLYHNAPKGYSGKYNVNWAIKTYVCKLQSPKQVVMGVPLYGRYWHNVEDKSGEYAIYRMANAVNGKFDGGFVSWKDIKKDWLNNPKYKHTFDQKVKSPYAFGGGTYLGYESPESVREKIKFALEKNLGGLMAWEIGQDDDENSMIDLLSGAQLCTNNDNVNFKCTPIDERRWWTYEENEDMAGLCGKSAPLYKGYYPLCDPDDLGYSCCGSFGFCGSGSEYCDCPTCVDYTKYPEKILEEPIKPKTGKVLWHLSNAPDGSRGRCGKDVPKVGDAYAICNPDDPNAHCCSNGGYCGSTSEHCDCKDCINFKKNPDYRF